MRWVLLWVFPVAAQAGVPSTVSDGFANALVDGASLAGIVLGVYGALRAHGWTNSEIRSQGRGEH